MTTTVARLTIHFPTLAEFSAKYRHYGGMAAGSHRALFDFVMRPDSFIAAVVATDVFGLPAVAGVAAGCATAFGRALEGLDRQFVGAVMCSLLEANSYSKTGQKKAVPQRGWSRGEVYMPPPGGWGARINSSVSP